MANLNPGLKFRQALKESKPLQIVGVINALVARLAKKNEFKAIYLSGAGVANCMGLPDLALTSLQEVVYEINKITANCDLPLIVDADTGFGSPLNVARTIQSMETAQAAGLHLEDQQQFKRCGHRDGKKLVATNEMQDRIKAAVDGRQNSDFFIIARTDAIGVEGLEQAIERAIAYQEVGADGVFVEGAASLDQYQQFKNQLNIPILANITEFGKTPIFNLQQLAENGVDMALYPLTAFRVMNCIADKIFAELKQSGTQEKFIDSMQTREQLYDLIDYYDYEKQIDKFCN